MTFPVLAIGDLHCKVSSLHRFDEACRAIMQQVRMTQPKMIVLLGDIANDHERIHTACMHRISTFFEYLAKFGIPVYYIVGNHDMQNNTVFLEPKMNTIVPLAPRDCEHFHVVSKPLRVETEAGLFVMCPYVFPGRFIEALDTVGDWRRAVAIMCHQEFRGAKLGIKDSVIGDVWPVTNPLAIPGHIHDFDELQPNIIYPGAPMQHGFSEKTGKTISLFEFEAGKLVRHERRSLGMVEKTTIKAEDVTAAAFKDLVEANKATFATETRLIVTGSSEELTKIKASKAYKSLPATVKVVLKPDGGPAKVADRASAHGKSYQELFAEALKAESQAVNDVYTEIFSAP